MKLTLQITGLDEILASLKRKVNVVKKYFNKNSFIPNSLNEGFVPNNKILEETMTPNEFAALRQNKIKSAVKKFMDELKS